jgi:ferric-dicitrate binding protein FerR (iron transport regulator)
MRTDVEKSCFLSDTIRLPNPVLVTFVACLSLLAGCGRGRSEAPSEGPPPTVTAMPQRMVSEPVGTLRRVVNEEGAATTGVERGVRIVREGRETTPELGMELREGDTLATDGHTRIVLTSALGSEIFLGPDSEIKVRKASVFLNRGRLFSKLKELFRLETRYVVAGVEGTEVDLSVDSGDVVSLTVLEGKVRVASRKDRWTTKSYGEGEHGVIRGEAEPTKNPLDPKERKNILRWVEAFEPPPKQTGAGVYR